MNKEIQITKESTESTKPSIPWNVSNIFWGLLLVLIGSLFLLDNLGVITLNVSHLWQLWPILIIGAGLSMLSLRSWIGAALSLIAVIALLTFVAFAAVENPWYQSLRKANTQTDTQIVSVDTAKKLDVSIKTGAAAIDILSSADQREIKATLQNNGFALTKTANTEGDTRFIELRSGPTNRIWTGDVANNLNVDITRALPLALHINTGATSVRGDLSQTRLTSLDIDTGASSVDLRLGAVESKQDVSIDAGASKIILHIPQNVGVRIESDSGLSSTNFENVSKISDSVYESTHFGSAAQQITIRAKIGISSLEVVRY